jgi:rfaE bifunctional protein kinase chain/domain
VGVIGKDGSGEVIKRIFSENGFPTDGIIEDAERPTTVKTRIIAHHQHVVRTDREVRTGISKHVQDRLLGFLRECATDVDGIIMEDYNKGLFVPRFIEQSIGLAKKVGKMTFVDPKFDHFFDYVGVTLFKPNRKEVADRIGYRLDSDEALEKVGRKLLRRLECSALMITLGEEGMALFEPGKAWMKVPTKAVKVHDVSGAGDTVIATMTVSMTAGANLREAATIANHAAGIVCGEVGIVPVEKDALYDALLNDAESS